MSRLPSATDLLQTARATLLEKLLPALPADLHYEARMIANALAIAARESTVPAPTQVLDERILAAAIRAGEHDGGSARANLLMLTCAKLEVSNPRILESYARLLDQKGPERYPKIDKAKIGGEYRKAISSRSSSIRPE